MPARAVRIETQCVAPVIVGLPYRGMQTGDTILRLIVAIESRGEVAIQVDDASVVVHDSRGTTRIEQIDQLFIVERQPPPRCFLTWFGVFARRQGKSDRLLIETPEGRAARFIERTIETRLGLRDEPVRGELRLAW